MTASEIKLAIASLFPVIATVLFFLLDKKTPFGKLKPMVKQAIYGVVFGALAVVGTEWGIPMNGAQVNCRDAAVLTAGLMFGAPAGIVAGVIGGVERWIAVAWGVGSYTRVACSVSTLIAGLYSAALRKLMFEDKKPGWLISFAVGIVMEVFHLTMVFLTNMSDPERAMEVVKACTIPMLIANACAVLLSSIALTILNGKSIKEKLAKETISRTIQRWLLVTVLIAFFATSGFVYSMQTTIAERQTDTLLDLALEETKNNIMDASDENLLAIARKVKAEEETTDLETLRQKYGLADINHINTEGIVVAATDSSFKGYPMASGTQSAEFLCLLDDKTEFVQKFGPIAYDHNIIRKYAGVRTDYGFLQVGYDTTHFQAQIDEKVKGLTKNSHVGKTGYIMIADEDMDLVSAPEGIDTAALKESAEKMARPNEGETFLLTVGEKEVFCRFTLTEGYYIIAVLPEDEAMQMRNIAIYVNSFMEVLAFAVLFGMIYQLIRRAVVDQIHKVNGSLSRITEGDLDTAVDVRTNVEFIELSDGINATVDALKGYIAEASARIDKELEFAKNIQSSALPRVFPAFPQHKEFDIYATMNPAKEVGGDFYDFYLTHDDTLHFLIADVSGKGIPAAMFMMRAKTELKSLTETDLPIDEVFTRGNAALCEGNDAGMFVTAWQGGVSLADGSVRFANAGHNPPLVRHADGSFEYLRSRVGFVLAGMDGVRYKPQEMSLAPGDTVFLYTDGVTEAQNAAQELFGEERLLTAINEKEFADMEELCRHIKARVDEFVGDAPQFDDITMVALRYFGKDGKQD